MLYNLNTDAKYTRFCEARGTLASKKRPYLVVAGAVQAESMYLLKLGPLRQYARSGPEFPAETRMRRENIFRNIFSAISNGSLWYRLLRQVTPAFHLYRDFLFPIGIYANAVIRNGHDEIGIDNSISPKFLPDHGGDSSC